MTPLIITSDRLRLELLPVGASVRRLQLTGGAEDVDLVLGHRGVTAHASAGGYLGATIGRFSGRIDGGRLTIDGTRHQLGTNHCGNTLHGGPRGFDSVVWSVADHGRDYAIFTHRSPAGDQGFPGTLSAEVTYRVDHDSVHLGYRATTDAPTVVNLTNHSYFNLDGATSSSVDDHLLQVLAPRFLRLRDDLIPTGDVASVVGSPFDLRRPRRITDVLGERHEQLCVAGGLDHTFVDNVPGYRLMARLVGASGRWLEVRSDQPGLQVYTGNHFDHTIVGLGGRAYGPRAGIALETQGFPDAPNHPHFPRASLFPDQHYRSATSWTFGV